MTLSDDPTQAINLEAALAICDGDRELFGEIAQVFLEDAADRMEQMKKAVDAQDSQAIAAMGHALKGLTGNIGADPMKEAALQMERSGKNNDLGLYQNQFETLNNEYQRARTEIQKIISSPT
ncbi:MAG: Hpt domain-containing protein [Nitrospinae bacterium]|nr:Hpt domain-containing protein [Nitrospinota bacterium]